MIKFSKWGVLLGAMLWSFCVYAGEIRVDAAWARATVQGQDTGMVDLTITSQVAASLVAVSSSACAKTEIHSMTHDNGMMKMREVQSIELPAGTRVNLGDNGYHLMLVGLKAPFKAGQTIPLVLSVKTAPNTVVKVEANAVVKPLGETMSEEHMDHMDHMDHMHH